MLTDTHDAGWPSGPGEMAGRIRAYDWAVTPLGPIEAWPLALRSTVELVLAHGFPMVLLWGPELVQIYNDGYRPILGDRHPGGLGQPTFECWPETFDTAGPIVERTRAGERVTLENAQFEVARTGAVETAWFTATYSPVLSEGEPAGVLITVFETTARVLAEQERTVATAALRTSEERQAFLLGLSDTLRPLGDPAAIQLAAATALGRRLGANRVAYGEADDSARSFIVSPNYVDGAPDLSGRFRYTDYGASLLSDLRSGRNRVQPDLAADDRLSEVERKAFTDAGIGASMNVPLVKDGHLVAFLGVNYNAAHDFQPGEIALVEEVAERTWAAVERARAEAALHASGERQAFLLRLADALRPLADPIATQEVAAHMLGTELAVDRCYYAEFNWPGDVLHIRQEYVRSAAVSAIGTHPISAFKDLLAHSHMGEPLVCDAIATHPVFGREAAAYRERGTDGFILVPLVKQGTMVACMCVTMEVPRQWSPAEVALVEDVAERTWAAVERARAEVALRESEGRLATVFEALPVGIGVVDRDGVLLRQNQEMQRFLLAGIIPSRDPEAADRWRASDEDRSRVEPQDYPTARALRGERALHGLKFLYTDKAGDDVWTRVAAVPLRGEDGAITGAVLVVADIDEIVRSQEAARESEERFAQFAASSSDALWVRDAGTLAMEYTSSAIQTIYGIKPDAILGDVERWLDLIELEDQEIARTHLEQARAGEEVVHEFRIRRPSDGEVRWIRNTDFPLRDEAGRVQRIGGIAEDSTEQKRAEERLRESRRRQQALIEGIPQLVWRAVDGGKWTWASPQWTAYTGQAEADSHGWGWQDAVHPEDRPPAREAWSHAIETGGFEVEVRLRRQADDTYRWFQTRATPVRDEAGTIVEWLGTSTDVDDLRRLHQQQGTLLAELQHRVRNTLAVIRSLARRTRTTSESLDEYADSLSSRLGAFARVQSMVTRSADTGLNLDELLAEELAAHGARDGERASIGGPPVRLRGKAADTLGLVVHELATNALKYGALATDTGQVAVTWTVEPGADGEDRLRLVWLESGAAIAAIAPRRRGFGSELIERQLRYELDAETAITYAPGGITVTIDAPLAQLAEAST